MSYRYDTHIYEVSLNNVQWFRSYDPDKHYSDLAFDTLQWPWPWGTDLCMVCNTPPSHDTHIYMYEVSSKPPSHDTYIYEFSSNNVQRFRGYAPDKDVWRTICSRNCFGEHNNLIWTLYMNPTERRKLFKNLRHLCFTITVTLNFDRQSYASLKLTYRRLY